MNASHWPLLIERLAHGAHVPVAAIEAMTCRAAATLASHLEAHSDPREVVLERETIPELPVDDETGEWLLDMLDEPPLITGLSSERSLTPANPAGEACLADPTVSGRNDPGIVDREVDTPNVRSC